MTRGRAPTHGPSGGVADSLEEAKAAFRAAGERSVGYRGGEELTGI
jgi:hypothetical protein